MKSLQSKVVVITGAGSGIGRSLALQMAKKGANLGLCDIDETRLAQTAKDAESFGVRTVTSKVDVSQAQDLDAFAHQVHHQLGPTDVLINNAGVILTANVDQMSKQDFDWIISVNLSGVFNGTQSFIKQLLSRPEAYVVNVSSMFGLIGVPGQSAYCASKFAVRGFTESLQSELKGTPVKVLLVHPGGVRTNIIKDGRHYHDLKGDPIEADKAALIFEHIARTNPDQAAQTIIRGIQNKRSRIMIGHDAYLFDMIARLFPRWSHKIIYYGAEKMFQWLEAKLSRQGL